MPSVRDLIDIYRQQGISYPQLVRALAGHDYDDLTAEERRHTDLAELYQRAEEIPGDDSFFWIEAAVDDGTLTLDQVDEIEDAIDAQHRDSP